MSKMTPGLWELLVKTVRLSSSEQRLLLASSTYDDVAELARYGRWDDVRQALRNASIIGDEQGRGARR